MGGSILALGLGSCTETQEPQKQHSISGEAVVPELRNVSQLAEGTSSGAGVSRGRSCRDGSFLLGHHLPWSLAGRQHQVHSLGKKNQKLF